MEKRKFSFRILAAMLVATVVLLCSACGSQPKKDAAPQDAAPQSAEQAYEAFIQEQKAADKVDEIYAAITSASEDGSPVLLIAKEVMLETQAIAADVYSFADGQVVKICNLESGGSAYPIGIVEGKYLVCGSHHSVERCLVSGSAASVEILSGYAMEEGNCKMTTYTVANDEITDATETEISTEEADDFADAIYAGWEPVEFAKY